MDEVWAPRDCEPTLLSSDQAIDIRKQLLAGVKSQDVKIPSERELIEQAGQAALAL